VTVHRCLTCPPEGFDPNLRFRHHQADCVSLYPLLDFAGESGCVVTYSVPACFLDYNRGEYIISPEKIRQLDPSLSDLRPFVASIAPAGRPPTSEDGWSPR
jgi:hypothetical protein